MTEKEYTLETNENFPKEVKAPEAGDILAELAKFGVAGGDTIRLMDSTREAADIRLNYIIDKKWVLRFCNAPDMTEKRMGELDRLVERYRAMGYQCPAFLHDSGGKYLHPWNGLLCYLSEYIDLPLARERDQDSCDDDRLMDRVMDQVMVEVARFAERYRNVDLSDTVGMYSLFELNPYDALTGKDEKQDNFESLMEVLRGEGEEVLARCLESRHEDIRSKLKAVYRDLPRCVFQGDENTSNVLVDGKGNFAGFIDFNLAGTEVIVNQLANLAGFEYGDEEKPMDAWTRLEMALQGYQGRIRSMLQVYHATRQELQALTWYAWIVMISQWPTASFFEWAVKGGTLKGEICELLSLIADVPEERLWAE